MVPLIFVFNFKYSCSRDLAGKFIGGGGRLVQRHQSIMMGSVPKNRVVLAWWPGSREKGRTEDAGRGQGKGLPET